MSVSGLKGKVIIVTGGGAGIGWGISQVCAAAGAQVIIGQRSLSGEDKAKALRDLGQSAVFYQLDVSSPDSITAFMDSVEKDFGRLDGLVNNAGVTIEGDFMTFKMDDLNTLWNTNVRSIFLLSQRGTEMMARTGGGSIVNVSSNHSVASVAGYEMYAGTKGAISAMTRAMCWSVGRLGVRVNTLSPGLTKTESVAEVAKSSPRLEQVFNDMHATGSYATVEQIGNLAAFLLSDAAAAITGADIVADHGLSAQLCRTDDLK
ncbi:MAG: SDR family oxidoreductase [Asticcacaulis sp.]